MLPAAARAERGALTLEAGAGVGTVFVSHPFAYLVPEGVTAGPVPSTGAATTLRARYALTHDHEVGFSVGWAPPRVTWHEHPSATDPPQAGYTDHTLQTTWGAATGRVYLLGYDWRLYLEAGLGVAARLYDDFDHCTVAVDERCHSDGPGDMSAFVSYDLLVQLSPGLEHVWDHAALGLRPVAALHVGPDVVWRLGVEAHVAWSWYP